MKKVILLIVLAFSLNINAQVKDSTKVDNFQKTDQVLSKIVEKALIVAEKTGNFVIEQTPLLLQEFYNWHITESILGILLGICILLLGRYIPYLWLNKERTNCENAQFFKRFNSNTSSYDKLNFSWILFILLLIISISIIISNLYNLLYLLIAPKLYLIEYFIK